MIANTAPKTEVAHLVIINKNEDVLIIVNMTIEETRPRRITHPGFIHQKTTSTSHLKTDINHQDETIATNHLDEIPDINHLEGIPDINHPDELITDHLIETTDHLNIAQVLLITGHAKMIVTHLGEVTKIRTTDHHQQTVDSNINQVLIDNNHLTDQDHHINNKATVTAPHHLTDSQTNIKVIQETADRDLHIAQTTDKDQEVQEQDHFME